MGSNPTPSASHLREHGSACRLESSPRCPSFSAERCGSTHDAATQGRTIACAGEHDVVSRKSDQQSPAEVVATAVEQGLGALDEWQAKSLLAEYGIAVPESGLARDEDEAVAIARQLDGPVVVKAVGSHISHKTEHGLVALDLRGDEAVRVAARSLLASAPDQRGLLLVEQMVRGAREFMIG